MAYVLIRHKVADYQEWKPLFDEHGTTRKASGSTGGRLLRSAEDPNELVILLEWDDLKEACRVAGSEDLRRTMQRAGAVDKPDVYFLEEVERPKVRRTTEEDQTCRCEPCSITRSRYPIRP